MVANGYVVSGAFVFMGIVLLYMLSGIAETNRARHQNKSEMGMVRNTSEGAGEAAAGLSLILMVLLLVVGFGLFLGIMSGTINPNL